MMDACVVSWPLLLEFFKLFVDLIKVVLSSLISWPLVALLGALYIFKRYNLAVESILKRLSKFTLGNAQAEFAGQEGPAKEGKLSDASLSGDAVSTSAANAILDTPGHGSRAAREQELASRFASAPKFQQDLQYVKDRPAETVAAFWRMENELYFERAFSRIYGTQISLLESLSLDADQSVPKSALQSFHTKHQELANSKEYPFNRYLAFLHVALQVVDRSFEGSVEHYRINDRGIKFLQYLKDQYGSNWDNRTF